MGQDSEEQAGESTPEQLQERIDQFLKERRPDPGFGTAMALVVSLGVTFIAVMYGSFVLGNEVARRTGSHWALPVALLLGVAAGSWVGYLLIRPLLRDDR